MVSLQSLRRYITREEVFTKNSHNGFHNGGKFQHIVLMDCLSLKSNSQYKNGIVVQNVVDPTQ